MFRLTYYSCTNSAGFRSGLGVKKVNLDLSTTERLARNAFIISGNNATGKSVLSESIHPFTTNTGSGRQKFFIDGKEGLIIREYLDEDGTRIYTRMVYSPKSGGGHNTKCFFSIERPGEKEPTELNPTGNVSSYLNLVKTYFGITKDFVSFASYSEAVKGLVTETSYARKSQISSLIPNTNRFEVAYNTINEKYKTTRALARNVAQKMIHLRDEDTIRGDLNRCEADIASILADRESTIKNIAEAKGKISAIAGERDVEQMIDEHKAHYQAMLELGIKSKQVRHNLEHICQRLGIDPVDDEIEGFINRRTSHEMEASRAKTKMEHHQSSKEMATIEMNDLENDLSTVRTMLFSLQTQDVEDLEDQLKELHEKIDDMEYSKNPAKYADMSYAEVVTLIDQIEAIRSFVMNLHERYGDIFEKHFSSENPPVNETEEKIYALTKEAHDIETRMETITAQNRELYQYRRLQTTLEHRPAECHIDTCPFIRDALKWPSIAKEIEKNEREYDTLSNKYRGIMDKIKNLNNRVEFNSSIRPLISLCVKNESLLKKYLNIKLGDLYNDFAKGIIPDRFSSDDLKYLAATLSEKELFERITRVDIPEIEGMITLAKNSAENKAYLEDTVKSLNKHIARLADKINRDELGIQVAKAVVDKSHLIIDLIDNLKEAWDDANNALTTYEKHREEYDELGDAVEKIVNLMNYITEEQKEVDRCDSVMQNLAPKRERLKYDLNQFNELTLEKAMIERDFALLDIMRSIVAPGKGVWGECIALYMDDVRTTTNQLLLNMFGGNLYLDEFIITDKEFTIPYVYNGSTGEDVSMASSSQQAAISMALSLAIISKMAGNYGICVFDEADAPMSPANKEMFAEILIKQAAYIGLTQIFVVTHSPEIYSGYDVCRINFPGARIFDEDENVDILDK